MTRAGPISAYLKLCHWLDRAALAYCVAAALFLTGATLAIVILRYGFGTGSIQFQNAADYAFASLLVFAIPVTLARGGHVRVEVISERLSPRYIRIADILAVLIFLIPVFGLMIRAFWPDLSYSWSIREGAVETGGLGGVYIVKTALPLASALMILQGLAMILKPAEKRKDVQEIL
ncbi:C4-dicarboxylate ABC transporter substrate-binding protein [Rhodovulum sulfidophilum]|uniref:TRAP transporter small permease protein n=1 Tax=Rhodovulum visakhapatnamense TaxID=364297 RepID=A0A4V6QAU5_9RHOB|nr:TRAP transporter small permease subunit [Rhodovulum visakhapatnamense]MBL3568037.1 TRAP transporter small permease subunit [Rhodovulum visakhapatnamense]MBL3577940.1 TRAP transporter small permease subunit [Rhodovulum visakhapatnamense]OLS46239.1 C4-dicarboxylate ABC transporter substrate-binding protein [Rhodovulum sulfidophilum]TDX30711.1 tripartite ATP-independent transporter DctQ subunit [Rhodovulum visakhapatnamense]